MADNIQLEIVSPERLVLSAQVSSVTVPGEEGYFTVMGSHAPMMTTLKSGFVTVGTGSDADIFFVNSGFSEVTPEGLTLLAEEARPISEFSNQEVEDGLRGAKATLDAATSADERTAAQVVVSGLENLLLESDQLN